MHPRIRLGCSTGSEVHAQMAAPCSEQDKKTMLTAKEGGAMPNIQFNTPGKQSQCWAAATRKQTS